MTQKHNALPVFIGYDQREHTAYDVCVHSILRHAHRPVYVKPVYQAALRATGLYNRHFHIDADGQRIDEIDGKPFSTEFSFTRFLVPALNQYDGWAIFVDCDFLFTTDISEVMENLDPAKAVYVVKHRHEPTEAEKLKMDGCVQTKYARKNWSSFMVLNCNHHATRNLTPQTVNHEPGSFLHQFQWCKDEDIGELDNRWNWLAGVQQRHPAQRTPAAIHYTLGGPWFEGAKFQEMDYAHLWMKEFDLARYHNRGILHDE